MSLDIWIIPSKVNSDAAKKRTKAWRQSWYRDDKSVGHKTINGIGVVGKLRRRKK